MRFIRNRSRINCQANFQNHLGYLPPIKVIKKSFEPVEGKGKSVIDEGNWPLDGQFHKADSYSTYDDAATQDPPSSTAPEWWITESYSLVFIKKSIAITSGLNVSSVPLWKPSMKLRMHWKRITIIFMRCLIEPGPPWLIWRLKRNLRNWSLLRTSTGRGLQRRNSSQFQFLTWWTTHFLHSALLSQMKNQKTLQLVQGRSLSPRILMPLYQPRSEFLQRTLVLSFVPFHHLMTKGEKSES